VAITHFDEAFATEFQVGHIHGRWTMLGEAAGAVNVGVRRIEVREGGWSTPAHEHGRSEEIFYVLAGSGLSWHKGEAAEIRAGDAILYAPRSGTHTVHAYETLDVLAFGTREYDESPRFPQLGMTLVGGRAVDSVGGSIDGAPIQFVREADHGAPQLPPTPDPRPPTIVNIDELEPDVQSHSRVERARRDLGRAIGSQRTGIKYVEVPPGREGSPLHCHSVEEEIFVVLDGDGVFVLGQDETPVGRGHVIARPAATGVGHLFRAGDHGLTFLAYGMRDPADLCYYPNSNKIAFRGVGVIARLERLDYWDGED
jgi:uncharacterized cupin superfamily protein